jgi:hypothetical protein
MEKLHDWHVTAYMLAVHGHLNLTRVREVDGSIVVDNDPDKEALCKAIDEENRVMIERLHRQTEEAWQQRCENIDTVLQAALAPPPAPRIEPAPPIAQGGKKWTEDKLAELRAYRNSHTMPETAAHFKISEARIRKLDPREKPKSKGYGVFTNHLK